jgi:ribonuclease HII
VRYLIGIDEVGRGCLAGPVVVAALAMPVKFRPRMNGYELRDSKRLTKIQRNDWNAYIKKQPKIFYAISRCSPKTIDKINIAQAANRAATRAISKLITSHLQPAVGEVKVFLDGGLYLLKTNNYKLKAQTFIKGDETFSCIKLASILAKVSRDKMMIRLHKKFPQYRLDKHKGYGTEVHIKALKKYGPSELHRLTFLKNFVKFTKS